MLTTLAPEQRPFPCRHDDAIRMFHFFVAVRSLQMFHHAHRHQIDSRCRGLDAVQVFGHRSRNTRHRRAVRVAVGDVEIAVTVECIPFRVNPARQVFVDVSTASSSIARMVPSP